MLSAHPDYEPSINQFTLYYSAAYQVMLRDATFPPSDFQLISGMAEVKWDKIPAGENVTHAMVVMPLKPGYFNFTSADVTYKTSENAQESQVSGTERLKRYSTPTQPIWADKLTW